MHTGAHQPRTESETVGNPVSRPGSTWWTGVLQIELEWEMSEMIPRRVTHGFEQPAYRATDI